MFYCVKVETVEVNAVSLRKAELALFEQVQLIMICCGSFWTRTKNQNSIDPFHSFL